jgi:hypothetical protein
MANGSSPVSGCDMKYEIKDTKDIQPGQLYIRKSPYTQMIEAIKADEEVWTLPETARMLSVSPPTLRKAIKGTGLPTKYVQWGKRHVWLFTSKDVKAASKLLDGVKIKWE